MLTRREVTPARRETGTDPFALLRQMTSPFDRWFEEAGWPLQWPRALRTIGERPGWLPGIDVFERDNRLITRVDLPGLKKEDVKVEVTEGQLVISGERRTETEEKKDQYYRTEREFGRFVRTVPLPAGVAVEDIRATFTDGVLEVSVPLPAKEAPVAREVRIDEPPKAAAA
jgi:HSP20 family protein